MCQWRIKDFPERSANCTGKSSKLKIAWKRKKTGQRGGTPIPGIPLEPPLHAVLVAHRLQKHWELGRHLLDLFDRNVTMTLSENDIDPS